MRAKVRAESERGGEEKKGEERNRRGEHRLQTSDAKEKVHPGFPCVPAGIAKHTDNRTHRNGFPQTDLYRANRARKNQLGLDRRRMWKKLQDFILFKLKTKLN